MNYLLEYLNKNISAKQIIEKKIPNLIKAYNSYRNRFLLLYLVDINKRSSEIALVQDDYYTISNFVDDIASEVKHLDFFLETPGGSGETAEDIVRLLRARFDSVEFIIAGETKSAGTILTLSGDEIWMTKTGSLGPIDAQMKIGRTQISAHGYMEWVKKVKKKASKIRRLEPFEAVMTAQVSPGELTLVKNSLSYAKELVQNWLVQYKFKNWYKTETRGLEVTEEMKIKRAKEIASALCNQKTWLTHRRSIKAEDLENLKLKVRRVEKDKKITDIIYRLHTLLRLLYSMSDIYKIFATEDGNLTRQFVQRPREQVIQIPIPPARPSKELKLLPKREQVAIEINSQCPKCGRQHKILAPIKSVPNIKQIASDIGAIVFPKTNKLVCQCGFLIDLLPIKNKIEMDIKRKIQHTS